MKRLMLALAATILLSCQQNETSSTSSAPTGNLALRIVSAKALATVESVSVKLSWEGLSKDTTVGWNKKSLRLEGLPLDVRIAVHMEGWNPARGHRVVVWSGDTATVLGGGATSWNLNDDALPIRIVELPKAAAPDVSNLLKDGRVLAGDSLMQLFLGAGDSAAIRLDGSDVEAVYADSVSVVRRNGEYVIVVRPGTDSTIEVVGTNGLASIFRVGALRMLGSLGELVNVEGATPSRNGDTLSVQLPQTGSVMLGVGTAGVVSVTIADTAVALRDGAYHVAVSEPDTFKVLVKGAGGQEKTMTVFVLAADPVAASDGLGAHLVDPPLWAGATCNLTVRIDSGSVSGVVLLKPLQKSFKPASDSLWKVDWQTAGDSDSVVVEIHGTGSKGLDTIRMARKVHFDRKGPDIVASDTSLVVGKNGGTVSWTAMDDHGVRSTDVQDKTGLTTNCSGVDACRVMDVKRSFTISAIDQLGNESTRKVNVRVDSLAPEVLSVKNAANDKLIHPKDTLSTNETVGLLVSASDTGSTFLVIARRANSSDSIVKDWNEGAINIPGLKEGTWTITVRDAVGNVTVWGELVVRRIVQTGDLIPGFGAHVQDLPQWVSKGCSVVVVRDSGAIDSVVSTIKFEANPDKRRWSAWWPATKDSDNDSLSIAVHGLADAGGMGVIRRVVRRGIDTAGPMIKILSALENDFFLVGKAGKRLSIVASDNRNVDSVWFDGSDSPSVEANDAGRWSGVVTSTVTVHAVDSLGNESFREVRVTRDSLAPTLISVRDLFGKAISTGDTLHSGGDSGLTGLVLRASDEHGVVARMRNDGIVLDPVAHGDSLVFRIKSGGSYTLEVQDTLGNVLLGARNNLLAGLAPAIPTFPVNLPDGVYGGDGNDTLVNQGGTDVLPVTIKCPDATATLLMRSVGDKWYSLDTNAITSFAKQDSVEFRCVKWGDSSAVVKRWWIMLQRPWIKAASLEARHGRKAAIKLDSVRGDWMNNPKTAKMQFCIADSVRSSECEEEANWHELTSDSLIMDQPFALFARVRYWYGTSNGGNNYHSKASAVQFVEAYPNYWHRTFDTYAYDTSIIWRNYRGYMGQVAPTNKSDASSGSSHLGVLKFLTTWKTSGRPSYLYPSSYLALQIDTTAYAKEHDFSGVDSIRFHYAATGTFSSIRLYPVSPGNANYWADGPQWSSTKDSGYVTIIPSNLAPVDRNSQYAVEWESIKTAITELRFVVVPDYTASSLVPTGTNTTVEIDDVVIYSRKSF